MSINKSRAVGVLVVAVAAVAGTMLATVAFASGHSGKARNLAHSFSVLAHPLPKAHAAVVGDGLQAPPGAVLADVTASGTDVYAAPRSNGAELCVVALRHVSGGAACGSAANAEEGVDLVSLPANGSSLSVTLLLPNSVQSVVATDSSGSDHTVSVSNNVAVLEEPELESVEYTLPSGATKTIDIAPLLKREAERVTANR